MIAFAEVVRAIGAACRGAGTVDFFTAVCTDTRKIIPGCLFIALKGENFDGHRFCTEAVVKGAAAVVAERLPEDFPRDGCCLLVPDTLKAYQQIAREHRRNQKNLKVVAITGSNGKTGTKDLLAACLSVRYNVVKTEKNFNNEIGLPQTLLRVTGETDVAVVEMGMRGRGQIAELSAIAEPDIALVTNVGDNHLGLLGSREKIAEAKSEIVRDLQAKHYAVLNFDDPLVVKMRTKAQIVTFGLGAGADVRAEAVELGARGSAFTYYSKRSGAFGRIEFSLLGIHNVMNALAAIAVADLLGLSAEEIRSALRTIKPEEQRQEILRFGDITVINDSYNASPASMAAGIATLVLLKEENKGRAIAVLADMLELGTASEEAHRRLGGIIAEAKIDLVIAYGNEMRSMVKYLVGAGIPVNYCADKATAAAELQAQLLPRDTVLIKGSHSMRTEDIVPLVFN